MQSHQHTPPQWGELDRVRQQIGGHLLQPLRIAANLPHVRREFGDQLDALTRRRRTRQVHGRGNDFRKPQRSRLDPQHSRADPAEIGQVIHHLQLRLRALLDAGRDRRHLGIVGALQRQNAIPTQDRIQGGAQFVGNNR